MVSYVVHCIPSLPNIGVPGRGGLDYLGRGLENLGDPGRGGLEYLGEVLCMLGIVYVVKLCKISSFHDYLIFISSCHAGWNGTTCNTATCSEGCVNGNCSAPDSCMCMWGWNGTSCAIPVCTNGCVNNGVCVAPESCNCTSGWTGSTCAEPICSTPCGSL